MRIVIPEDITPEKITANTSAAEAVAEYDSAVTYKPGSSGSQGDQAVEGETVYEAVAEVTGVAPSEGVNASPPSWIEVRTVNPLAMWNGVIGDSTRGSEPWPVHTGSGIQMEVSPGVIVSDLAFFGLDAESVRVELLTSTGEAAFDEALGLIDETGINTYWTYFFTPVKRRRDVTFGPLPPITGKIRISIQQPGANPAQCGVCVIGAARDAGCLQYKSGGGLMSFSRKRRDEFGRILLQRGDSAKTASYQLSVDKSASDALVQLLTDIDATRVVFIGTIELESSLVYGITEDFRFVYENFAYHVYSVDVVGLT